MSHDYWRTEDKVAAIMSTSSGKLGGLRELVFLRMLLNNIGVIVLPEQQVIPQAGNAFKEDGGMVDEKLQQTVYDLGVKLT